MGWRPTRLAALNVRGGRGVVALPDDDPSTAALRAIRRRAPLQTPESRPPAHFWRRGPHPDSASGRRIRNEYEVILELDGVGHADDAPHLRLLHLEILEGEGGGGIPGYTAVLVLSGHLPDGGSRHTANGQ